MTADAISYGRIQGFLKALEMLNNDAAQPGYGCCFRFVLVPQKGSLVQSLAASARIEDQERGGQVRVLKPELEGVENWQETLPGAFGENSLWWNFASSPTARQASAENFMRLLLAFLEDTAAKVWSLRWRLQNGHTIDAGTLTPSEWVFEHGATGEWFKLTLSVE